MTKGVIVGCDKAQEKLLFFWWLNYKLHNNFPLTFMDFGMSEEALAWCKERGEVVSIKESLLKNPFEDFKAKPFCPNANSNVRMSWFKKPLALMQTPYEQTIWVDIDCLIRGNLLPLFKKCDNALGLSLLKEPSHVVRQWRRVKIIDKKDALYNSGVIVYKKDSFILKLWIDICSNTTDFRGDQEALSALLSKMGLIPQSLNWRYNWLINSYNRISFHAKIIHFTTLAGKEMFLHLSTFMLYELRQQAIITNTYQEKLCLKG